MLTIDGSDYLRVRGKPRGAKAAAKAATAKSKKTRMDDMIFSSE